MRSVLFGACAVIIAFGPSLANAQDPGRGDDHGARAPVAAQGRAPSQAQNPGQVQPPGGQYRQPFQGRPVQDRAFQGSSPGAPSGQRGAPGVGDQGGRPNDAAPQQGSRFAGDQGPRGYDAPRGYAAPGQGGQPAQNDRGVYAGGRAQGYAPDQGRPYAQDGARPYNGGPNGVYGAPNQGRAYGQSDRGYDRGGYNGRQEGPQYRDRGQAFAVGGREYYRFRGEPYRFPTGYDGWSGHRWRSGEWLPPAFISTSYFIDDYYDFGLWQPDYGFQWIRVGSDAVLIDLADGRVVDEVPGVYYY